MKTPYDIPYEDLLVQLAEECSELAQAALKYRRALLGEGGYTTVSVNEAYDHVVEEHADICNCFKALRWQDTNQRENIMEDKWDRWLQRINCERLTKSESGSDDISEKEEKPEEPAESYADWNIALKAKQRGIHALDYKPTKKANTIHIWTIDNRELDYYWDGFVEEINWNTVFE